MDINNVLKIIHEYFPEWKNPEEICMDAEAVHQIASVIKLQSEWVKHRSTSLYTDPFLIEEKLRKLPKEEIGTVFLESWHPVVELEQLTPHSVEEATRYWQNLAPLNERWQKSGKSQTETATATREELLKQHIIAEKEFSQELEGFWQELKNKTKGEERIEYWNFVGAETYEETVRRAYLISFLVTYGFATLEVDRLEEVVYIKPYKYPISPKGDKQAVSLPIPVDIEDWKKWREGEKD